MLLEKINYLMEEINKTVQKNKSSNRLPANTYFLENGYILCCERENGESRFPYSADGYTLWAYSNGHIHAVNGIFNIFKPVHDNPEPAVGFYAGVLQDDGTYFPISILGGAQQLFEPFKVNRYLVYSLSAAYYIADTDFATFAVRTDMSPQKELRFSFICINKNKTSLKFCLTSYFDAFLKRGLFDDMWSKCNRACKHFANGSFALERFGDDYHALVVNRKISRGKTESTYYTSSKIDFLGYSNRRIGNAESLKTGRFDRQTECVCKNNTPIAAEIIHINTDDYARVDYVLPITDNKNDIALLANNDFNVKEIDAQIENYQLREEIRLGNIKIHFNDWNNSNIDSAVLNKFIGYVCKQVDFCAMNKYYVDYLLGIRDVFQQLEQAILWDPTQAREKILRALSYIDPSGRSPRQISITENHSQIPTMDLREFIDQGNWIISCIYSYISWTNDFSILNEECGYYKLSDYSVGLCDLRDSCLEHLIKITDYLVSNIDYEDLTNCLRILYGDWNDSIDGLGKTNDEGKKFGTGVSVMSSLQLYQNLLEMSDILMKVGGYEDKVNKYLEIRRILGEGLFDNAIDTNENGEQRLIHGWGDHKSYKMGSFCDSDGKSRISFAPNAFWAISGLIKGTPELKSLIIESLHKLDSRFGLKTLIPHFEPDAPGVGRIAGILPGTAENECVYCHASMFSIMALFLLGDSEYAWKQLEKTMVISHEFTDKSAFVMSNSYLDNPENGLNGESAIDWYTGAGTVFIKNIVRFGLGIDSILDGIIIQTPSYMPCKDISAELLVKGFKIKFIYKNVNSGERKIYLNGKLLETEFDDLMNTKKVFIPNNEIKNNLEILVCD